MPRSRMAWRSRRLLLRASSRPTMLGRAWPHSCRNAARSSWVDSADQPVGFFSYSSNRAFQVAPDSEAVRVRHRDEAVMVEKLNPNRCGSNRRGRQECWQLMAGFALPTWGSAFEKSTGAEGEDGIRSSGSHPCDAAIL